MEPSVQNRLKINYFFILTYVELTLITLFLKLADY